MKHPPLIFLAASLMAASAVAGDRVCVMPTNAPARIELHDQFDWPRTLVFPTTNITLLTIADKAGSEQIAAWVAPVKDRFKDALVIEGIADLSAVPRPLRGLVRRKFQKAQTHPVMLDWSGEVVKSFAVLPDRVNVFVLDEEGNILKRLAGKATEEGIEQLGAVLQQALADNRKRVASR
jgi:hypothetical protein